MIAPNPRLAVEAGRVRATMRFPDCGDENADFCLTISVRDPRRPMNPIKHRYLLRIIILSALLMGLALALLARWSPGIYWTSVIIFWLVVCCLIVAYRCFLAEVRPLEEVSALATRYVRKSVGRDASKPAGSDPWLNLRGHIRTLYERIALNASASRENSEQLKSVLEGIGEGVLALRADRKILTINAAAKRLLGIAQPELVGRKLLEVCRLPELNQLIEDVLQSGKSGRAEFETTTVPRYILAAHASTRSTASAGRSVTVVLHDVTDMRRLETMRRDFFSNVSHELKTPLASIKAYAETLKMGAMNDPKMCAEFVDQIESDADRLNQQIQDLLQLSRVESGQYIFDMNAVCLSDVCHSCVRQFASTSEAAEIELTFVEPAEEWFTWADEEGVEAILNNLISNAIRYTPNGGKVMVQLSLVEHPAVDSDGEIEQGSGEYSRLSSGEQHQQLGLFDSPSADFDGNVRGRRICPHADGCTIRAGHGDWDPD